MRLGRIRRGRISPGDRVDVEAVAGITRSLRRKIHVQLERVHLRFFADLPRGELIRRGRQAYFDAGLGPVERVHARQPGSRGARMIVKFLIDRGAQVDATTKIGWTPLMLAEGVFYANAKKEYPAAAAILRNR